MVWVTTEVLEEIIRAFSFQFSGCQKHRSRLTKVRGAAERELSERAAREEPLSPPRGPPGAQPRSLCSAPRGEGEPGSVSRAVKRQRCPASPGR